MTNIYSEVEFAQFSPSLKHFFIEWSKSWTFEPQLAKYLISEVIASPPGTPTVITLSTSIASTTNLICSNARYFYFIADYIISYYSIASVISRCKSYLTQWSSSSRLIKLYRSHWEHFVFCKTVCFIIMSSSGYLWCVCYVLFLMCIWYFCCVDTQTGYRAEQARMLSFYSYYANLLFCYLRPPAHKEYIAIANIMPSQVAFLQMLNGMGPMRLINSFIEVRFYQEL